MVTNVFDTDYVLVWEVKSRKKRRARGKGRGEAEEEEEEQAAQEESRSEKRKAQLGRWRDRFIQNLQGAGLLLEKVLSSVLLFCSKLSSSLYSFGV